MKIAKQIFLVSLFYGISYVSNAQCAMCKAVAESDLAGGGTAAQGINEGILYLMFIPYILIGGVGYFIYKHYMKNKSGV
ncbi:hypothetical protein FRY74_03235 [Vicingus serpentipes]|jgi:hypothetical protein|uniref:Uncharacterized protein n=1 Tax=Vicingus serpentipes TaxID=1926625 RepID=A0A5C6RYG5_9FLAO|nr:hypothetical protein [Vicingus serpentipes]TXB67213.1 hypothetical protein FRY74_03235 [Vicingus serpentipes]